MIGNTHHGFLGGMIVAVDLTSNYPYTLNAASVFDKIRSGRDPDEKSSSEEGEILDPDALNDVMDDINDFVLGEEIDEVVEEAEVKKNQHGLR